MMKHPCHKENVVALKRIEGQVRGVQKMIEEHLDEAEELVDNEEVVETVPEELELTESAE